MHVTAFGRTRTLTQWSRRTGLNEATIHARLRRGWSPEQAVARPSHLTLQGGRMPTGHHGLVVSRPLPLVELADAGIPAYHEEGEST